MLLCDWSSDVCSSDLRAWEDQATYDAMKADLLRRYGELSVADMVRGMDEYFPGEPLTLAHLFLEERRRVLDSVIRAALDKPEETYRHIWAENRKLVHYLLQVDVPVPDALRLEEVVDELAVLLPDVAV